MMPHPTPLALSCLLAAAIAGGCRLPGYDGPVSQSLATARQYSQRGVAAMERGRNQEAEQWLAKAVKACPGDSEARRHYAEILWQRGAKQEGLVQMREAVRRADEDATLHVRMAEMYLDLGQVADARKSAERAIDLNPKLASAWAARARVQLAAGQPQDALADYHRALGFTPEDRRILLETAEVYRRLNEPQRALQSLQGLAETYSPGEEPQQVLHLMGLAYVALARYDDAVDVLGQAVTRGAASPDLYCHLGEAEMLAGRPAAAAAAAEQALALSPVHQPSRELLSRIAVANNPRGTTVR